MSERSQKIWQRGDIVVLRYVENPTSARMVHAYMGDPATPSRGEPFLVHGQVVTVQARPYRVVEDSGERVVLFQPDRTPLPRWSIAGRRYLDEKHFSAGDSVRIVYPARGYDVTLFFETEDEPPWFYAGLFDDEGVQPGWRVARRKQPVAPAEPPRTGTPHRFRGWYINLQETH